MLVVAGAWCWCMTIIIVIHSVITIDSTMAKNDEWWPGDGGKHNNQ